METAPAATFDLVLATVARTSELDAFLDSLERQRFRDFRVLVVDQNDDDRLDRVLERRRDLSVVHLRSARGLNRARNVGLAAASAELVAFPDDDCAYPPDLLERVVNRFAGEPRLDGVTGRTAEPGGATSDRWPVKPRILDLRTVWHGGNSASLFLRRDLVERLGRFDEAIGFGSGNPWELADEIDLLVRAIQSGATLEQDPSFVVHHAVRRETFVEERLRLKRVGAGVGYVLGKNRVATPVLVRRLVNPLGGIALSLARLDLQRARLHATTLRWRLVGYWGGRAERARSSANSSA
ncbi:MAG: glycosyltransferase family A protein [Gaiellales bacterium]